MVQFAALARDAREEAVQEVTANALVAFVRLVELGKSGLAYPTVLARFGIAQVRAGRQVGVRQNTRDALSRKGQWKHRFHVERLDRFDQREQEWREVMVEDHRTPVPEQVAFRCDYPAWLKSLSCRDRRLARFLARGESTSLAARPGEMRRSAGNLLKGQPGDPAAHRKKLLDRRDSASDDNLRNPQKSTVKLATGFRFFE